MAEGRELRLAQAAQTRVGDVVIGVVATPDDDVEGPFAVLGLRLADGELSEIELAAGESATVPGLGALELVALTPTTAERRGAVLLRIAPTGAQRP